MSILRPAPELHPGLGGIGRLDAELDTAGRIHAGYCVPQTLVTAGVNSHDCCAEQTTAIDSIAYVIPNCFIFWTS